jgi:hypothetical protein
MTNAAPPSNFAPSFTLQDPSVGMESALESLMESSSQDMQQVEKLIQDNMKLKQMVRNAQTDLQKYQADLQNGTCPPAQLQADKDAITGDLGPNGLNLPSDSALSQLGTDLPGTDYKRQDGTALFNANGSSDPSKWTWNMSSDDRNKLLDGPVKDFQTALQSYSDSLGDLAQQYQFRIQNDSDVYNRNVQAVSNMITKYSQASDAVVANYKS